MATTIDKVKAEIQDKENSLRDQEHHIQKRSTLHQMLHLQLQKGFHSREEITTALKKVILDNVMSSVNEIVPSP